MLHFFAIFAQNYLNTLMEQYIVSARKYRPTTFKTVVGQKSLTTTLKNAIDSDRLAQAYLFCGPRGVGKTSCARIFAKTINCLNPTTEGDACNECESCRAFNEGRSFNIIELDAASNNSVDDIRGLTDQVRIPPQIGKYRVFIIDEVHMLSVAAFNAFLKTLEEPPKYVIFILATTEKHKVIPTILSRCQIYDFNRITINDMVEHLAYVASAEGISAEPAALNVIAQKADGAMRDALSIFDQVAASSMNNITYQSAIDNLNVLDYDYYFKLVDNVTGTDNISEDGTYLTIEANLFEINGDELRVVSLDGHRISIRKIKMKNSYAPSKVIIPGKTLNEISKILSGDADKDISIYFTDKHALFEFDNTTVVSRLIEGEYFKIDQMLSNDYETKLKVNKKEFLSCIDRATLLVKEGDKKPIIINITDNSMELKINSTVGSMNEEIDIEKNGRDLMIGFNPKFLIDALRVIDDETISVYLMNPKSPCFIRDDENNYIYLILPVNFTTVS